MRIGGSASTDFAVLSRGFQQVLSALDQEGGSVAGAWQSVPSGDPPSARIPEPDSALAESMDQLQALIADLRGFREELGGTVKRFPDPPFPSVHAFDPDSPAIAHGAA